MWRDAAEAADVVLQVRNANDAARAPLAEDWASFHVDEMAAAEERAGTAAAAQFAERFPEDTARRAVAAAVAADPLSPHTLGAVAWCARNDGVARDAEVALAGDAVAKREALRRQQEALERRLERAEEIFWTGGRGGSGGGGERSGVDEGQDSSASEGKSIGNFDGNAPESAPAANGVAMGTSDLVVVNPDATAKNAPVASAQGTAPPLAPLQPPPARLQLLREELSDVLRARLAQLSAELMLAAHRRSRAVAEDDSIAATLLGMRPSEAAERRRHWETERAAALAALDAAAAECHQEHEAVVAAAARLQEAVDEGRRAIAAVAAATVTAAAAAASAGGGDAGVKDVWQRFYEDATGYWYRYNEATGESVYETVL
ncbi:unnamed protein product [Phaeothamnion confervicola]